MAAQLKLLDSVITFTYRGREIRIKTGDKGNTILLVSHEAIQKSIKFSICAYAIFTKDYIPSNSTFSQESNANICSASKEDHMSILQ